MAKRLLSRPGGVPAGVHEVPGDKSISHRALMLAAAAGGETLIENFLDGDDCRATASALRALGVDVLAETPTRLRVRGDGGFRAPRAPLDLGNSGTGIRLLAGLLAGHDIEATLTGDASLRSRPMRRIVEPLSAMGADIASDQGCAPLRVRGRPRLKGIDYAMPVASAQVKSAILLAGLVAESAVVIRETGVSRDHTERMLQAFGATLSRDGNVVRLEPGHRLRSPGRVDVPGDLSSAAFLLASAALYPGAAVTVENVGINPTRAGFLDVLARMGAAVELASPRNMGGEPAADVTVVGPGRLEAVDISAADVALAIDEIPVLLALAAFAEGETVVSGAAELRVKESDRLAAMADGLTILGIRTALTADGIRVFGGQPQGGVIDSRGDHRIAMSFAVAGLRAAGPVEVPGSDSVATSFPGFAAAMRRAGLDITERAA